MREISWLRLWVEGRPGLLVSNPWTFRLGKKTILGLCVIRTIKCSIHNNKVNMLKYVHKLKHSYNVKVRVKWGRPLIMGIINWENTARSQLA